MNLRLLFSPRRKAFALPLVMIGLSLWVSCGSAPQPPAEKSASTEAPAADATGGVKRYQLHGKVVSLDTDNQAATIQHDEIVGWMDAMTMRFPVKEKADWDKLAVGKQINATVFVSDDGFYIGNIEVVGEGAAKPTQ